MALKYSANKLRQVAADASVDQEHYRKLSDMMFSEAQLGRGGLVIHQANAELYDFVRRSSTVSCLHKEGFRVEITSPGYASIFWKETS